MQFYFLFFKLVCLQWAPIRKKCNPTIGCQKCKDCTFVQKNYQFFKYLDLGMRYVKELSHTTKFHVNKNIYKWMIQYKVWLL